jgi:hypothetical protein
MPGGDPAARGRGDVNELKSWRSTSPRPPTFPLRKAPRPRTLAVAGPGVMPPPHTRISSRYQPARDPPSGRWHKPSRRSARAGAPSGLPHSTTQVPTQSTLRLVRSQLSPLARDGTAPQKPSPREKAGGSSVGWGEKGVRPGGVSSSARSARSWGGGRQSSGFQSGLRATRRGWDLAGYFERAPVKATTTPAPKPPPTTSSRPSSFFAHLSSPLSTLPTRGPPHLSKAPSPPTAASLACSPSLKP